MPGKIPKPFAGLTEVKWWKKTETCSIYSQWSCPKTSHDCVSDGITHSVTHGEATTTSSVQMVTLTSYPVKWQGDYGLVSRTSVLPTRWLTAGQVYPFHWHSYMHTYIHVALVKKLLLWVNMFARRAFWYDRAPKVMVF